MNLPLALHRSKIGWESARNLSRQRSNEHNRPPSDAVLLIPTLAEDAEACKHQAAWGCVLDCGRLAPRVACPLAERVDHFSELEHHASDDDYFFFVTISKFAWSVPPLG